MATTDPVSGWDQRVLAVKETTFLTTPNAAGSQSLEIVSLDMGPVQQADARPKKDKTEGRDETLAFVSGRYLPVPFSLETSVKSRAAVDTTPRESAIYQAGGLIETVSAGVSVTYAITSAPTIVGLSIYSALGATPVAAEQGFGGLVKQLAWEFGDKELWLKASGAFAGKYHLGSVDSATVADASTTTVTLGAGEAQRFGLGWYQWESEIVLVSAVNTTTEVLTIARGALSSVAAAHSAKAITPYIPTVSYAGSPVTEANVTVTIGGVASRCTRGSIELETGVDHLPPETGSSRVQGGKVVRVKCKAQFDLVLTRAQVSLLGKSINRTAVAVTVVCGTGAGGIVTFSLPTCEIRPFTMPAPADDVTVVSIPLAVRGNSGNDLFSYVAT